jgi:hypothetical protein
VTDYLNTLSFLQHADIDLGDYSGLSLTSEQIDAIGSFDIEGNFTPNRQLILGPPGKAGGKGTTVRS